MKLPSYCFISQLHLLGSDAVEYGVAIDASNGYYESITADCRASYRGLPGACDDIRQDGNLRTLEIWLDSVLDREVAGLSC